MKKILVITLLSLSSIMSLEANSAGGAVDSVGFSVTPITSYNKSGLTDGSFPTGFFLIGGESAWRLEYLNYKPNETSNVLAGSKVYDNSAVMGYYNLEYLLRARRGTVLGRTRLFVGVGAGLFRSRVDKTVTKSEYNIGFGALSGFRYFIDKKVYFGGEAKYLNAPVVYQSPDQPNQDIGGLFFSFMVGFRFDA